jgi:2-(1,2-epoxy-1,2-dihydrophenyl)acetyl-CoA isomerase
VSAAPPVLLTRRGGVMGITLNRPERRNAIAPDLSEALLAALESARRDDAVRAVVLSGSGPTFCAGLDLRWAASQHGDGPPPLGDWVRRYFNPVIAALAGLPKPVVAAVQGTAAGAGLGLALACDLRVASAAAQAVLAFPAVGVGLDSGLSLFLVRLLGRAGLMRWLAEGGVMSSDDAVRTGLWQEMVGGPEPPASPMTVAQPEAWAEACVARAWEVAGRLAEGPTRAYAAIKEAALGAEGDLSAALEREGNLQERLAATADHREGLAAFFEHRKPRFTGM